ncbi:MAG: beta-hydroxyacyl-ACP dehydratase [Planctomycetota bacterium]|nr:beta-hydroxyacyl-ACP dehydratase [Planctomycetota bacterium]
MWIDTIVEYEPGKRMVAVKNVSLAEEHLHDHFPAEGGREAQPLMPASLMIEGMAQTAGILVGSINRFREKVILAKIAGAEFDADVAPGQTIRYEATLERIDEKGASTRGLVSRLDHRRPRADGGWEPIGRIDLMFSHVDRNVSGLEFPEENFVFSDNFRTILRSAGLHDLAEA